MRQRRLTTYRSARVPVRMPNEISRLQNKFFLNIDAFQHRELTRMADRNGYNVNSVRMRPPLSNAYDVYMCDAGFMWCINPQNEEPRTILKIEADAMTTGSTQYMNRVPNCFKTPYGKLISEEFALGSEIDQHRSSAENYRQNYINSLTQVNNAIALRDSFVSKASKYLDKFQFVDGMFEMVFENVVAEDTCASGDDINLGTLKFGVSIRNKDVYLLDGEFAHDTQYRQGAFHPHQMSNRNLCFGSMSADVVQAVSDMDLDLVQVMLSKFAHSYSSNDSAGAYWKLWAGLDMDEDDEYNDERCWVPSRDEYYDEDYVVWSEYYEEYLHQHDAVHSEVDETYYLPDDDEIVMLRDGDYTTYNNAVELFDESYVHDSVVTFEYDGLLYIDEDMVTLESGDRIPLTKAIQGENGAWILNEEA